MKTLQMQAKSPTPFPTTAPSWKKNRSLFSGEGLRRVRELRKPAQLRAWVPCQNQGDRLSDTLRPSPSSSQDSRYQTRPPVGPDASQEERAKNSDIRRCSKNQPRSSHNEKYGAQALLLNF